MNVVNKSVFRFATFTRYVLLKLFHDSYSQSNLLQEYLIDFSVMWFLRILGEMSYTPEMPINRSSIKLFSEVTSGYCIDAAINSYDQRANATQKWNLTYGDYLEKCSEIQKLKKSILSNHSHRSFSIHQTDEIV